MVEVEEEEDGTIRVLLQEEDDPCLFNLEEEDD